MPVIRVMMIKGYAEDVRRRLGQVLTDAVRRVIAAPADGIIVAIEEVEPSNYLRGRVNRNPGPAVPDPVDVVRSFLMALEAGDEATAETFLADGDPPGSSIETLRDAITWQLERCPSFRREIETIDVAVTGERLVVYCAGTLGGVPAAGERDDAVRCLDRFELTFEGQITRHQLWRDAAQT